MEPELRKAADNMFGGLSSAGDLLARNARNFPDDKAVIFENLSFTWADLNRRANRFTNAMIERGIRSGDRVAIYARNSNQWVEALFGLAKAGIVAVTVNYRLTGPEAEFIAGNAGARAIIFDSYTADNAISAAGELEAVEFLVGIGSDDEGTIAYEDLVEEGSASEPVATTAINPDDPCMLLYTSGTTGFPKGAVYTHQSLLVGMLVHVQAIGSRKTHRVMLPAPLYSAAGIAGIFCAVYVGSQISLINYDVKTACKTIERDQITFANLVPTTIQMLLESDESREHDLTSLEVLLYGGSPIPEPVLRKAMKRFPRCGFRQTFATTETGCAGTVLEPSEHRAAIKDPAMSYLLTSCGRPQTNVDVKLVGDDWEDIETGETGEIAVRTEANMPGYWNDPEATSKAVHRGWVRTGDMARMDGDGYFYLVDRKSDMIVSGALNVYPSEVERIIHEHPAVYEVAVIGVPSEKWGEEVKAIVAVREGETLDEKELIEFCGDKIAGFKKPKSVEFVESLPRNLTGKILKKELREKFAASK